MEALRENFKHLTDEQFARMCDMVHAEVSHQKRMQDAAGQKNDKTGVVTCRIPPGTRLGMFGGVFIIQQSHKGGFTAVCAPGTKINPQPLPPK